ncbi:MAG TPA: transglutaminase-like cysteine peptidase [Sphingomicrobium sp.]|nr:transglutaminase-like cysteine peptidase [Sphingomicrobium sp.]
MSARSICGLLAAGAMSLASPAAADTLGVPEPKRLSGASPDVFGTTAIGAGVTFYDARFRRVAATDRTHPMVMEIARTLEGMAPEQQLSEVHRQVLQKVRWAHDLDTMRVADLWANAGETLERGTGDSEDIAVVIMQVLKAAGWDPRDLYISIGRERKVGTHIVLLARAPSGFYILDDRANRAMTPQEHARFTPILTLSEGKSWLHGRRRGGRTAAQASVR